MGHSIKTQMQYAFDTVADSKGQSKRSYRGAHDGYDEKVFSRSYGKDLRTDRMPHFARYLKENYPDVKMVKDIKPEHLQGYFDLMAKTCNTTTLGTRKEQMKKIEQICQKCYGRMNWKTEDVRIPMSECPEHVREYVATDEVYKTLKDDMRTHGRSEAWKSLPLSRYAGCRLNEAAEIKIGRLIDHGGRWGYGTITLQGKDDGTKGGRWRTVDITSPEALQDLKEAIGTRSGGEYVIQKEKGGRFADNDSISARIRDAVKRTGAELPKHNKNHAFRKLFAQDSYDLARCSGDSKRDAADYSNKQLGHGKNRDDDTRRYVHNQW